jgi:hypothetical protein
MSVGARPGTAEPTTATAGAGATARPDMAGRVLATATTLPVLLAIPVLLAGLPLLVLKHFSPVPMIIGTVIFAAIIVPLGLRHLPAPKFTAPWWTVAAIPAIAVAFGVFQAIHHSQFIVVTRDPASYIQFAAWISGHHSLPIPQQRSAFGANHQWLEYKSFAFYQVRDTVVPQFMVGLPMVLSFGFWAGGVNAALLLPSLLGAAAVLTFGGLATRLMNPRWAVLATAALAVSLPEMFTSRSAYSEPLTQILFLGGLALMMDALRRDGTSARVLAAIAGLGLGLTVLVRIDGASDVLPLIPYVGLMLIGRRTQALPLLGGAAVGALYGLTDAVLFSRPYLRTISASLKPLAALVVLATALTVIAVLILWRHGVPTITSAWLLNAVSVLPFAVLFVLWVRPDRHKMPSASDIDRLNIFAQEFGVRWLSWYAGVPIIIAGAVGIALLSRRCLRGDAPEWTLALMTFCWASLIVLYRPAITPDQPWGSRRLVPAVLPGFILLAVWTCGWAVGKVRALGYPRVLNGGLATVCSAVLLLPVVFTSWGVRLTSHGVVANGLATRNTYRGEVAAVEKMCAAFPKNASVVIISGPIADRLLEAVRGMCGLPAARITSPKVYQVRDIIRTIERVGRVPAIVGNVANEFNPYPNGVVRRIVTLNTQQDEYAFLRAPRTTMPLTLTIWMWEPAR